MSDDMMKDIMDELVEEARLVLTMDDETEVTCLVLGIFEVDGVEYIAVSPETEEESDELDVYIYTYSEDTEGNPLLGNIDDEAEYQAAFDALNDLLDAEE